MDAFGSIGTPEELYSLCVGGISTVDSTQMSDRKASAMFLQEENVRLMFGPLVHQSWSCPDHNVLVSSCELSLAMHEASKSFLARPAWDTLIPVQKPNGRGCPPQLQYKVAGVAGHLLFAALRARRVAAVRSFRWERTKKRGKRENRGEKTLPSVSQNSEVMAREACTFLLKTCIQDFGSWLVKQKTR